MDYMVKTQVVLDTDEVYVDFGVKNDPKNEYKKFRTANTEYDAIYEIKANAPINTEAHSNVLTQLRAGKLRFLIDERVARNKLMATSKGLKMKPELRDEYLRPFTLTSILKEEMLNLRELNDGGSNIILKPANKRIPHDKVSSYEYGLYYIKQEEDSKRKKKRTKLSDYMFVT